MGNKNPKQSNVDFDEGSGPTTQRHGEFMSIKCSCKLRATYQQLTPTCYAPSRSTLRAHA